MRYFWVWAAVHVTLRSVSPQRQKQTAPRKAWLLSVSIKIYSTRVVWSYIIVYFF